MTPENILCPPEAARAVQVVQGREREANNRLGRGGDLLERFPICSCAAGESRTAAGSQNALYGAVIEGNYQFWCEKVVLEISQKIESLLCLLNDRRARVIPHAVH